MRHSFATIRRSLATCLGAVAWLAAGIVIGGTLDLGFDAGPVSWQLAGGTEQSRLVEHAISPDMPHRGTGCERLVIEAAEAGTIEIALPLEPAAVIDELRAAVWVNTSLPGARLALRVRLDDPTGRRPEGIQILVAGQAARDADRWERLEVGDVPRQLARRLPALRLEHGSNVGLEGAAVTAVVVDAAATAGRHAFAIDDLEVTGLVRNAPMADPHVRPAAAERPLAADPPAGLARGVLEVAGLPFFPRAIEATGEPFAFLADLGFNCVKLPAPATADQLAEARAAGLWVICPPPPIPDVDLREPESVPMLRNWDRVLAWDLGTGLSETSIEELAERGRRIRACDPRSGRPLIGSADSDLRTVSRHLDMLVARRTVLGTSLELIDWLEWLRERPRLARPGTPLLCTLGTELDPAAAGGGAGGARGGGRGRAGGAPNPGRGAAGGGARRGRRPGPGDRSRKPLPRVVLGRGGRLPGHPFHILSAARCRRPRGPDAGRRLPRDEPPASNHRALGSRRPLRLPGHDEQSGGAGLRDGGRPGPDRAGLAVRAGLAGRGPTVRRA